MNWKTKQRARSNLRSEATIASSSRKGRGIQRGHDSASANFPLFFYPLCIRRNEGLGVPERVEWREYPGGVGGASQPIIQLLQLGWTGGQLGNIELGCSSKMVRSEGLEKWIIRIEVCWGRVTTIMRSTVINGTEPGIGRQKLSAFGTNGSQGLDLGRYIYTFGFLNTPGIDDLLGTI